MNMIISIISRYGAIFIQFVLIIIVTRTLPQSEAGIYISIFGVVTTTTAVAGVGIPDGLVVKIGQYISSKEDEKIRPLVVKAFLFTLLTAILLIAIIDSILLKFSDNIDIILSASLWSLFYSLTFFCAQCLVGLRLAGRGAFFAYTATNVAYLFISIPYLILSTSPNLKELIGYSTIAAGFSFIWAFLVLTKHLGIYKSGKSSSLRPVLEIGFIVASCRILQSLLAWIPVWVVALCLSASESAIYGTAGRLIVAATAVIASLRFSIRPEIIKCAANNDWERIETISRSVAFFAFCLTLLAIVVTFFLGPLLIPMIFGASYIPVVPILLLLLIGALGEAFGGTVDEILKMTGAQLAVLLVLLAAVVFETAITYSLSPYGIHWVAFGTAITFILMYGIQLIILKYKRGIWVFPSLSHTLIFLKTIKNSIATTNNDKK